MKLYLSLIVAFVAMAIVGNSLEQWRKGKHRLLVAGRMLGQVIE